MDTPPAPSRQRVLRAISRHGPVTTTALGDLLGITDTAVRRQVDLLLEAGLIAEHDNPLARRGRGRPARAYVVSDAGHRRLTSDYDQLAEEALRFLAETGGSEAVAAFARQRTRDWEDRYAAELAGIDDPHARVTALVTALTRDGFDATARPLGIPRRSGAGTGIQLCQGHCPVQHVAAQFPQFCDAEAEAFSRLLGVHVQRLATLAHGDHVCTTYVPTESPTEGTTR
ncbi:MAG: helix-turn-helix domain-containing protein [Tetrasphaera sp.]